MRPNHFHFTTIDHTHWSCRSIWGSRRGSPPIPTTISHTCRIHLDTARKTLHVNTLSCSIQPPAAPKPHVCETDNSTAAPRQRRPSHLSCVAIDARNCGETVIIFAIATPLTMKTEGQHSRSVQWKLQLMAVRSRAVMSSHLGEHTSAKDPAVKQTQLPSSLLSTKLTRIFKVCTKGVGPCIVLLVGSSTQMTTCQLRTSHRGSTSLPSFSLLIKL